MATLKRKPRVECLLAPDSVLPPSNGAWPETAVDADEHCSLSHEERVFNLQHEGGMLAHYSPEHFLVPWAGMLESEASLRRDVWGWAWAMFKIECGVRIESDPTTKDLLGKDAKTAMRFQRRFGEWARARLSWHRLALKQLFTDGQHDALASRDEADLRQAFLAWAGSCPRSQRKRTPTRKTPWNDVLCWLALARPVAKRWTQVEEAEAVLKRFGKHGWTDEVSAYLSKQVPVLPLPEDRNEEFLECLLRHIWPSELQGKADERLKDGLSDLHRAERASNWVTLLGRQKRAAGMARKRKGGRNPQRRLPRETEWAFDEDSPRGWRVAREITSSLATTPPSQASELLSSVIALFGELQVDRISSEEMSRRLELKPRELANQLRPLGIHPRPLSFKHQHKRGYCLSQFKIPQYWRPPE